jgi:purine-binding chemotaxis protein CheW
MHTTISPDDEERLRILEARARVLAREPESEPEEEGIEVVEFLLAEERYAFPSSCVAEVYPLRELTPLPCTPPFVLGVINIRGKILSVLDLRRFFDLPIRGLSDLNKVIVLRNDAMEFGILADVILAARRIALHTLQPSLPTLTEIRAEYLMGVTEDRLVVLDGGKILSDRRIVVHEEVAWEGKAVTAHKSLQSGRNIMEGR